LSWITAHNHDLWRFRAPLSASEIRRTERWLATARVALTVAALVTMVMEPGRGRLGANPADWQSFGIDPPSPAPIRAGGLPLGHEPVAPTVVIQPSPTSPAAVAAQAIEPPGPGATGPALPGLPSTRHGYGSGVGITLSGTGPSSGTGSSMEYPRYEPPVEPSSADVQLRPNRTILYAGASLLAVGVFVVIALAVAGNGKPEDIARHTSESPAATPIDAASSRVSCAHCSTLLLSTR